MKLQIRFAIFLLIASALAGCKDEATANIDKEAAARGASLAEDCKACHQLDQRENMVGPHLVDLYGRKVASVSDYEYSDALSEQDFNWDSEKLATFILDPLATYPGTMMAYDGLTEQQAADIAEYFLDRSND